MDYIPNPDCNLRLIDTVYEFEHPGAKQGATNFKSRLRALDNELQVRVSLQKYQVFWIFFVEAG